MSQRPDQNAADGLDEVMTELAGMDGDQDARLILTYATAEDAAAAESLLAAAGLLVRRRYRRIPALAVQGPALETMG
jgi:hypothetical protein